METIVIRGDGSKEGPSVVDSLLTTTQARQERGRVEIDTNCSSRSIRDITLLTVDWIDPGTFVEIEDTERGRVPGMATNINISLGPDGVITRTLRVETEAL